MQLPAFHSRSSGAEGEPPAPTANTVWIIKTGNCCSLTCAARSSGRVTVIDFSGRDALYGHCLYFSCVRLVQLPSSSAVLAAGAMSRLHAAFLPHLSSICPHLHCHQTCCLPWASFCPATGWLLFKLCFWPGMSTWNHAVRVVRFGGESALLREWESENSHERKDGLPDLGDQLHYI